MSELDPKAIARHARYVRNPSLDYLGQVLGIVPDLELATMAGAAYNFNSSRTPHAPNLKYYEAAMNSTRLLHNDLEHSLIDSNAFLGFVLEYLECSEYREENYGVNFRSRTFPRQIRVPVYFVNSLDNLLWNLMRETTAKAGYVEREPLGLDYKAYIDSQSQGSLHKRLEQIRDDTANALQYKSIDNAIAALYHWETSWLVNTGNHSRSMNYFNVLLEKIGYQPISHGVIDFAAFCMNSRQFESYMKYVIFDVENQKQK